MWELFLVGCIYRGSRVEGKRSWTDILMKTEIETAAQLPQNVMRESPDVVTTRNDFRQMAAARRMSY